MCRRVVWCVFTDVWEELRISIQKTEEKLDVERVIQIYEEEWPTFET
jgi:hypothetical protein